MKILNLLNSRKANTVLGVDINHSAINLLELSLHKQKFVVTNYAHSKLPWTELQANAIANKNLLITLLQSMLKQQQITTRSAIMAMPNAQVMTKQIQLDQSLNDNEIYEHLTLQKNQYLGDASGELCWDFNKLGVSSNNVRQQDIQLVAVRKNIMQERIAILEAAGLMVKAVDIESFALARIGNFLQLIDHTVLVHVHAFGLLLAAFARKKLMHAQEKNWPSAQQDSLWLAAEINQQLQLLEAVDQNLVPKQILLSGHDIPLIKLQEILGKKKDLSIIITKPFANMFFAENLFSNGELSALTLSCGLALGNFL